MINAVIELGDRRVHEVMVPRIAIVGAAASSAPFEEAIDTVVEEGHSRVPGLRRPRSTRSSASSTRRTSCRS